MQGCENGACQELFESISASGTRWVFVGLPDNGWAITCNGQRIAVGTGESRSIRAGVAQFTALTHPVVGAPQCDPAVQEHLDVIEGQMQPGGKGTRRPALRRT
jgi:hypothetical protein